MILAHRKALFQSYQGLSNSKISKSDLIKIGDNLLPDAEQMRYRNSYLDSVPDLSKIYIQAKEKSKPKQAAEYEYIKKSYKTVVESIREDLVFQQKEFESTFFCCGSIREPLCLTLGLYAIPMVLLAPCCCQCPSDVDVANKAESVKNYIANRLIFVNEEVHLLTAKYKEIIEQIHAEESATTNSLRACELVPSCPETEEMKRDEE